MPRWRASATVIWSVVAARIETLNSDPAYGWAVSPRRRKPIISDA
jgi:hypothetical protein